MNEKRIQFLLDITLPERSADGEPVLPACKGDIVEWLNQVKNSFPGLVATLSPAGSSKPVSRLRRHASRKKAPPARPSFESGSADFQPDLDGFEQLTARQKDIVNLLF